MFFTIGTEGKQLCKFFFAPLDDEALAKWGSILKGRTYSKGLKGRQIKIKMTALLRLKVYPFLFKLRKMSGLTQLSRQTQQH